LQHGGMTAAPAQLAGERGDVRFVHQSMYHPVTDDPMDTGSYKQFAESYFPTAKAMAWACAAGICSGGKDRSPSETRRHPTWPRVCRATGRNHTRKK
jgi:acetyl esterase/lipase